MSRLLPDQKKCKGCTKCESELMPGMKICEPSMVICEPSAGRISFISNKCVQIALTDDGFIKKRWTIQHVTSVGQRQNLSSRRESNP